MTLSKIVQDLKDFGLSQFFVMKGLVTINIDQQGLYEFTLSKGPRLSDGGIQVTAVGLSGFELMDLINIF